MVDPQATARTRARYDRIARFYDRLEYLAEQRYSPWRVDLWQRVRGPRVLEVGVGTGRNLLYYPQGMTITGIDLSPRMLAYARTLAQQLNIDADFYEADAQALPFPAASFDTAIATFVFCSVPNPVLGLCELRRVLAPSGQLLLLEHVLSGKRVLRPLMQALNPLIVRMMGANINRETVENVRRAGFVELHIEDRGLDIFKLIEARAPA